MPAVTVVVPVRNARPHLGELRRSCEAVAALADVEIIVIDDGSDDGGEHDLRTWAEHSPSTVTVLEGSAGGVARARNLAVEKATGDYVWFTDADDTWSPRIVSEMLRAARDADADVVVCNAVKVSEKDGRKLGAILDAPSPGLIEGSEALRRLLAGQLQGHLWNKLVRRSLLGGNPFPATRAHSDLGGMIGILARARTVALVPSALYTYVIRTGSILNSAHYRWRDLPDCFAIARSAVTSAEGRTTLARFGMCQIAVPLFHESVRRRETLPAGDIREMRTAARSLIGATAIRRGLLGEDRGAALRAAAIKVAPSAYARAYKRYRDRQYRSLDALT